MTALSYALHLPYDRISQEIDHNLFRDRRIQRQTKIICGKLRSMTYFLQRPPHGIDPCDCYYIIGIPHDDRFMSRRCL